MYQMDKHVLEKMDGSMRRLLNTDEKEIRKKLTQYNQKISRANLKLEKAVKALPLTTNKAARQDFIKQYLEKHPIPRPHRDILVLEKEKRVIRIKAVIRYTGNRDDLESLGIKVRSQAQDIFTISGTKSQLVNLVNQPACQSLRTPRVLYPTVEHASAQAEIADVHDPRPLNPTGFRGNGVLIGIIDSPLDVIHHGFRDPAGAAHDSRVLYYWAQSTHTQVGGVITTQANPPGNTPEQFTNNSPAGTCPNFVGLNYGRIYTNDYINTALGLADPYGTANNQICCEPTKTNEHGTHCAGIAAGNGHVNNWASTPTHVGAAPEATIIHVRLQRLSGSLDTGATFEDAMLEGIDFCLRAAQFHNMPIVITVSQGSSFGPHNGQSDFDLARDNFLNSFENRSIVYAAGNDNDTDGYRHGSIAPGNATDSFTMTVYMSPGSWLDIWNFGPELDYRISFGGSDSGWRTSGQDYAGNVGGRSVEADRDIESSGNMRGIRIYVANSHFNDVYTIELRNPHASDTANYYAWAGLQGWWSNLSGSTVNELTMGDTGCGKSILTVGACDKIIPSNPALGEQATTYSGAGPTVDGRVKPEIVAVGGTSTNNITSAASDQNSGYTTMHGTSMATPLVAGAIALLFEEYGSAPPIGLGINLDQDTIKALLTQHTNRVNLFLDPSQPGYVAEHRNRYGYGRLRMIGAIDHMLPPVDTDIWIRTADDDFGSEPYIGDCYWGAPDIRVCHAGTNNETTNITWGTTYDVKITVRNLGASDAVDATLKIKYTRPFAAPNDWFEAEDAGNNKLIRTITVPAMDSVETVFQWRPEQSELSAPSGTTHFCMLAEVDHATDPLVYPAPTSSGGTAWDTNIRGVNNVALRNLHIE